MQRSLGIFAIGIAVGLAIGFGLFRGERKTPASASPTQREKNDSGTTAISSSTSTDFKNDNILFGQIEKVPFQELYGLLSQRRPDEIAAMAQQLNELPSGREANGKIEAFFKAWSHLDPAAAFKAASGLKTIEARGSAIAATLSGADRSAAGSLAHSLVDLPSGVLPAMDKTGLLGMMIQKWGEADPPAAAQFFEQHPEKGMSFTLTGYSLARNWAASDPAAAIAWASQHPGGPIGGSALSGAISGWWQKDHAAAEAYGLSHANDPDAMQYIAALITPIVHDNPQRALAWVDQLSNNATRKQAESMLAGMWAVNDPVAASQWAAGLPNDRSSTALSSIMSFWAQTDPDAASQWLGTVNGTVRDNAIGAFSSGLVSKDPATALKWVDTIGDATIRDRALQQMVSQWFALDPVTLKSWIRNSSLSDGEKQRLLAMKPGS